MIEYIDIRTIDDDNPRVVSKMDISVILPIESEVYFNDGLYKVKRYLSFLSFTKIMKINCYVEKTMNI